MKYLGIDYGAARVGLAVSDEAGDFAYPFSVIKNSENLADEIALICNENKIEEIVLGESKDFNMEENEIMAEILPFGKVLEEKTGLTVRMHPEFMTSAEAERLQGKNEMLDASAAALILKSFLDIKRNN